MISAPVVWRAAAKLRIVRSAVDALSHAVLHPDEQTRYASISGKPNPKQRELIRSEAAKMGPASTVIAAFDADAGGEELVEILRAAVALTGRSDLRFETHTPEGGLKDFNDVLRQRRGIAPDTALKQSLG
jgi:Toprim-like